MESEKSVDEFTYSYHANSNPDHNPPQRSDIGTGCTAENNLLNTACSQTFTYDPLNRLANNTLGGVANQSWTLDSQGNWSSFTSNGTTQTQTANAQNQITSISGSATPTYDASGNMTTDQAGNTYTYNAWNQLVAVKNSSGAVIAQYTYNAMGYRVTETYPVGGNGVTAGTVNYIYYNAGWQAIETRTNGTAESDVTSQTVWSAAYINAAILQDTYPGGVIQPNSRLYFLQDANWNTTAIVGLVNGSWQVTQRYVYSPYGTITVLNANWTTPSSGTQPLVDNLYQGMTLDPVTGLYYARNRNYSPSLGRWINQDPAGYINGANTYQFVMGNPINATDPLGLAGEDGDVGGNPETPPPSSFMEGLYEFFGFEPYFGPPIVDTPAGYDWWYPPTIRPQGAPPDESLWQLQPTDPNNPATPRIDPFGPDGKTLAPQEQVDQAQQAIRDADDKKEPKPETKSPAREPYPKEGHHFLPKQFADKFRKVGLNPDDFVDPLPKDVHRLKPNGIHTGPYQESWNGQWNQFFATNPDYTQQDVLNQLAKMKHEFGVN